MPNHVINEIIFRGIDASARSGILANILNEAGEIDFGVLVPKPLNIWDGSCSTLHEKAFRVTGLDWARVNWGTKWNAYGLDEGGKYRSVAHSADTLTLTFQTAWRPPYGWIVALFNYFKLPFDHNWLDEGAGRGVSGKFNYAALDIMGGAGEPWAEEPADDAMQKHLHKLLWGVEEFPDDADEDDDA